MQLRKTLLAFANRHPRFMCTRAYTHTLYIQVQHTPPSSLPDTHRGSENGWVVRLLCCTEGQPVKGSSHPHVEHSSLENDFRPSAGASCQRAEPQVHVTLPRCRVLGATSLEPLDFPQWIPRRLPESRACSGKPFFYCCFSLLQSAHT